jgi:hypothetical protein
MRINENDWNKMKNDKKIRTQVVLTVTLKKLIEAKRRLTGETLSEYLRKAALLRFLAEEEEQKELDKLADLLVGSVSLKDHPQWKTKRKIQRWVRSLRKEWE